MGEDFFDGLDQAVAALRLGSSAERAAALLKLSSELVASLDARQALLSVGDAVRQLCQGERFVVLDPELLVTAARASDGVDLPTPLPYCAELARRAAETRQVTAALLPLEHPTWGALESVRALRLIGMIAVPMCSAHGVRGVIYCDGKDGFARELDPATLEILGLIGQHAAQAIDNAALMERVAKDPKNDLLSAGYFERRVQEELLRSTRYMRPFSLMFIDLLDAEDWLQRYGHSALDEIIAQVAEIVRSESRETDVLARMGPARLGLLLPEMHVQGTHDIERFTPKDFALRLHVRMEEGTFKIGPVPQRVRVRIGAVTYQQAPVVGLKGLLHEIELAIDVARREGDDHFLVR